MLQLLGSSLCYSGIKQSQMNLHIGIFVDYIHKHIPHFDDDSQLLHALPFESILSGFSRLKLASDKLP